MASGAKGSSFLTRGGKSLAERRGNLQNLKVEKAPQVDVAGTRCIRILKEEKLEDDYELQKCLHEVGSGWFRSG